MDALADKVLGLEKEVRTLRTERDGFKEEVKILRKQRDKFRQIATEEEAETVKRRVSYLRLENEYEEERRKRVKLEMILAGEAEQDHRNDDRAGTADNEAGTVEGKEELRARTHDLEEAPAPPLTPKVGGFSIDKSVKKQVETDMKSSLKPLKSSRTPLVIDMTETKVKVKTSPTHFKIKKLESEDSKSKSNTRAGNDVQMSDDIIVLTDSFSALPPAGPVPPTASSSSRTRRAASRLPITMADRQQSITEAHSPSLPRSPARHTPSTQAKASSSKITPLPKTIKKDVKSEGGWTLSSSQISRYLSDTSYFRIDPPPIPVAVSRWALIKSFGLPGMGLMWASKDKRYRFLTPTYGVNPEMPRSPGAPGLLLSCREEMCSNGPWTLFGKVEGQKKALMEYRGEYMCHTVGQMTSQEFVAQDMSVKKVWGTKVVEHKKYPIYRVLRARMALRLKFGVEPTAGQITTEADLIKTKGYTSPLTSEDVIAAFERGDEHISVVKIVCVSYNHERAQEFANAQETWESRDQEKSTPDHVLDTKNKRKAPAKRNTSSKKTRVGKANENDGIGGRPSVSGRPQPPKLSQGAAHDHEEISGWRSESEESELTEVSDSEFDFV